MALARLRPVCIRLAPGCRGVVDPGLHQTPIVDQLWRRRADAKKRMAEQVVDTPKKPPSHHGRTVEAKTPQASTASITYEFSKPENKLLVDKYLNPWGLFRVGRLLEDLDALAGTVAFEHCRSTDPFDKDLHIVTASVDRIKYSHRPNLKDDIVLTGSVTYVGRSSMEISMLAQSTWSDKPFMSSYFTFVARDAETGRAAMINPLRVTTPQEEALFKIGEQRAQARQEKRKRVKASQLGKSLDEEGVSAARELLRESETLQAMPALADSELVLMRNTMLSNTLTAMPQHRNTAGRIFGGFLMRRAYELAHATAYVFGGRRPVFLELDQVLFRSPVEVGDLLRLDSCVLYTSEDLDQTGRATVHVEVNANVLEPEQRKTVHSNTFNFTFGLSDESGKAFHGHAIELRRVVPSTLEEACRVLERYKADMMQVEEDETEPSLL